MQKARNINIVPNALPGRRLEPGWDRELGQLSGTYDKRKLEDLWKNPQWSGKSGSENIVQDARLTTWEDLTGKK